MVCAQYIMSIALLSLSMRFVNEGLMHSSEYILHNTLETWRED